MTKPAKVGRLGAHPQRYERSQQIDAMDVETEYPAMYKLTSMVELPWEFRFGWNLAFYRSFAVPRMAELLAGTGEMEQRTMKRARDTGLMMYELFEHGLDHPRSREVLRALNRMHRQWDIEPDDYRYILTTFAVVPTRFADRYGWRKVSAPERAATHRFYLDLGTRMGIREIPDSYAGLADYLDTYEAEQVRPSPEGVRLTALTLPYLATRVPGPLRSRTSEIAALFLDPRLQVALGLDKPRPSTTAAIRAALAARRVSVRRKPSSSGSWFTPGMVSETYPNGYELSDLGPPRR